MLAYLRYFLSLWLLYGFSLFCGTVASITLRDPSWLVVDGDILVCFAGGRERSVFATWA